MIRITALATGTGRLIWWCLPALSLWRAYRKPAELSYRINPTLQLLLYALNNCKEIFKEPLIVSHRAVQKLRDLFVRAKLRNPTDHLWPHTWYFPLWLKTWLSYMFPHRKWQNIVHFPRKQNRHHMTCNSTNLIVRFILENAWEGTPWQFFVSYIFLLYVFRLLCLRFFNCRKD